MRQYLFPAFFAAAMLASAATAHAASPPPDKLPGTIHFDSGSSSVKAKADKRKKPVRRRGNATMNKNAMRDGTGKQ